MGLFARPSNERFSFSPPTSDWAIHLGPFIADFACIQAKLILELDGNSHDDRRNYDQNRDFVLRDWGWKTLRFPNIYARDNPQGLWQEVEIARGARRLEMQKLSDTTSNSRDLNE